MYEGSRYLNLAEKIISARGIPLTGSQIIDFAEEYDALPFESYQTIVKTLQARISEDIAGQRNKSRFVRTGIGRYFLRRLAVGRVGYGGGNWLRDRGPEQGGSYANQPASNGGAVKPDDEPAAIVASSGTSPKAITKEDQILLTPLASDIVYKDGKYVVAGKPFWSKDEATEFQKSLAPIAAK